MGYRKIIPIVTALLLCPLIDASAIPPLSTGRHSHTTTLLPDGNFLVVGGVSGSGNSHAASAELYNTALASYQDIAAAGVARSSHTATVLGDGRVLIAGGFDDSGTPLNTAYIYSNLTNSFQLVGSNMQHPRGGHTANLINRGNNAGSVLICGGQTAAGYATGITETCEIFNAKATVAPYFKTAASMAVSRINHAATALNSGNIFISGGLTWSGGTIVYLPDNEIYDVTHDSWTPVSALLQARAYHTITTLDNGNIMIVGGYNYTNFFNLSTEEKWYYDNPNAQALQQAGSHGYLDGAEFFDPAGRGIVNGASSSLMPYRTSSHATALSASGEVKIDGGYGNLVPTFFSQVPTIQSGSSLITAGCTGPDDTGATSCTLQGASVIKLLLDLDLSRPVSGRVVDGDVYISPASPDQPTFTADYTASNGDKGTVSVYVTAAVQAPLDGLPVGYLISPATTKAGDFINVVTLQNPSGTVIFSTTTKNPLALTKDAPYAINTSSVVIREMIFSTNLGFKSSDFTWNTTDESYDSALPIFNHTYIVTPAADELITGGRNCENAPATECGARTFTASPAQKVIVTIPKPATGWTTEAPLNEKRAYHTSTLLADGSILTCGGSDGARTSVTCELRDPATKKWEYVGNMFSNRSRHTATLLPNGTVFVTGGTTGASTAAVATTEIYYPDTKRWVRAQSMSVPRQNHTATLMPDGNVLVTGGSSDIGYSNVTELFITTAAAWQTVGPLATGRAQHTATLLKNGDVIVTGGINGMALRGAEIFNHTTKTWNPAPQDLNTARYAHTATLLKDGRVLVTGGSNGSGPRISTELYNGITWTQVDARNMNYERANHKATLLTTGKVLITGGETPGAARNEAELFNTDFDVWANYALTKNRANHTAVLGLNGYVLVIGGWDGTQYLDSVQSEYFAPYPDVYSMAPKNRNPKISTATAVDLLDRGQKLTLLSDATNFHGITEASGGGAGSANSSFHNPRVYLQSMDTPSGFLIDLTTGIYTLFGSSNSLWENTLSSITVALPLNEAEIPYGYYYARAEANGQYSNGRVVQISIPRPTGLATNIAATILGSSSVTWTWNSGTIALNDPLPSGYALFSSTDNLFISTATYADPANYTQTGLPPNTAVSVYIAAYNLGGYGPLSPSATYYTYAAAPFGLAVTAASFETVSLTWNPNGNSAVTPYEVSVYQQSDALETPFSYAANISTPIPFSVNHLSTSTTLTTLSANRNYFFRVRAKNRDNVLSSYDAQYMSFEAGDPGVLPVSTVTVGNISNLQGTAVNMSEIAWSWDESIGATSYNIYDITAGTANPVLLSSGIAGNNYTQMHLSTNTPYNVAVQARKQITATTWVLGPFAYSSLVYTLAVTPITNGINTFTGVSTGSFTLNWLTNGNSASTVYTAVISLDSKFSSTHTLINVTNCVASCVAAFANLKPNYKYYAVVLAANGDGKWAAPLQLGSKSTKARPPANVRPTSISMDGVVLKWDTLDNSTATIYEVRSSTMGFDQAMISKKSFSQYYTSSELTITDLLTATTYYFDVAGRNEEGFETARSQCVPNPPNTVVVTVPGPNGAPSGSVGGVSNPSADTTIYGILPNGRQVWMQVPAASFAQATAIAISSFPASPDASNSCSYLLGGVQPLEFSIYSQNNAQPMAPVTITLSYSAVTDTTPGITDIRTNLANLVIARYNPLSGQCLPLETKIDTGLMTVAATLNHFSTFQLILSQAAPNLSNTRVFPNPLYLNRGNGYVTIDRMPASARVTIYTLSGDKVWEGTAGTTGFLIWKGVNKHGKLVASGVYLAIVDSTAGKKILKIAVER